MIRIPAMLLFCLPVLLAQGSFAASAPRPEDRLEEVVVEGTRAQLKQMVQVMVQLEDTFFERYNELNTNDDFDMHCDLEARIGTKLKRRYCRPVYEEKAMETEGQGYSEYLKDITPDGGPNDPPGSRGPPPPMIAAIEARREEYKDNMREVAKRNPELVDLLRQRYEMAQRYEATRRKVWGLKPPPEEETAPE